MSQCLVLTFALSTCLLRAFQQCDATTEGSCHPHTHCRTGSFIQLNLERRSQEYGDSVDVTQPKFNGEQRSDILDAVPSGLATDVGFEPGMRDLSSNRVAEQWRSGRAVNDVDMLGKLRNINDNNKRDEAIDQIAASLAETQRMANSIANAYQEFVEHTTIDAQAKAQTNAGASDKFGPFAEEASSRGGGNELVRQVPFRFNMDRARDVLELPNGKYNPQLLALRRDAYVNSTASKGAALAGNGSAGLVTRAGEMFTSVSEAVTANVGALPSKAGQLWAGFVGIFQGPVVIIILVILIAASVVALLSIGRVAHQGRFNDPHVFRKSQLDNLDDPSASARSWSTPLQPEHSPQPSPQFGGASRRHSRECESSASSRTPHWEIGQAIRYPPKKPMETSPIGGDSDSSSSILTKSNVTKSNPNSEHKLPKMGAGGARVTAWGQPLHPSCYLCSGLVVPPASECTLMVPKLEGASSILNVCDSGGSVAIQADVAFPDWTKGVEQRPIVVLYAGETKRCLAYCKADRRVNAQGERRAFIFRADGEMFGTLENQSRSYQLSCGKDGIRLSFEGDFDRLTIHVHKVWGDQRELFASTSQNSDVPFDPSGKYWQLRVVANMDVGLVLASVLCIQVLESPAIAVFPEPRRGMSK